MVLRVGAVLARAPRGYEMVCRDGLLSLQSAVVGLALLVSLFAIGCTASRSQVGVRAEEPVAIMAAFVRDDLQTRTSTSVPPPLLQAVTFDLERRNVNVLPVGSDGYDQRIAALRSSSSRLATLAARADGAPLILLVETRAVFYSQLSGRYRWTVDTRLTLAPTEDLTRAVSMDMQLPAFLFYDHQREEEAIAEVSGRVARQVGELADEALLAGWPGLPAVVAALAASSGAGKIPAERRPSSPPGTGEGSADSTDWEPLSAPSGDSIYFVMVDRFARPGLNDDAGDSEDLHEYWGGTINGLRERLDWLEHLGVRTVWISPVYLSREERFMGWGAFHGYWVEDHMAPWPRLGSFEALRALSGDLRSRGMRLMLDVVVNHVGYDAPLVEDRPEWFNRKGAIEDWSCEEQLVKGQVHGLPDLDQDNPEVYDYLLDHALLWIEAVRPDGFRLDAVKHVPLSFWRRFNADVKDFAGQPFYLLGEDLEGDPVRLARTLREGAFDALFDFPTHFAMVDVFCRDAPVGRLASMLSMDHLYGDDVGERLVTFLDNHDLPRIMSVCGGDVDRVKQALTTLVALRGTPAFTWGTETGSEGEEEPENRAPMRFDDGHVLHDHVRHVLSLRRERPWLASAETILKEVAEDLLVLMRADEDAIILVVNRGTRPVDVSLPTPPASQLRSLVDDRVIEGATTVAVAPQSVAIFELTTDAKEGLSSHLQQLAEQRGTTTRPGTPREVVVRAKGVPKVDGELRLVGAGEALGHWDLSRAVSFQEGVATVVLPAGLVAEYKLALVSDTETRWEEGVNRYLLVTSGEDPLTIDLTWREG